MTHTHTSPAWYSMERARPSGGIRVSWMSRDGYYRDRLFMQYSAREVRALMAQMRREGKA